MDSVTGQQPPDELPAGAADAILRHAGVCHGRWRVSHRQTHRFSSTAFVVLQSPAGERRYVVKSADDTRRQQSWSPATEYQNLRDLWSSAQDSPVLSLQEPVAHGSDPPYLVTVFVPGTGADTIVKSGCRRLASPGQRRRAADTCARIGAWVSEKRRLTSRQRSPYQLREYRRDCTARLAEIAEFYGPSTAPVVESGQQWLARLPSDQAWGRFFPITSEHGQHCDCTPQNFIIDHERTPWGIDFESYTMSPLQVDPCHFRFWAERMMSNPRYSRSTVAQCWLAFARSAADESVPLAISYIHAALAYLAWCRHPEHKTLATGPLRTRLSLHLWTRRCRRFLCRLFPQTSVEEAETLLCREL